MARPAPVSYAESEPVFGARKAMRSEQNIGMDDRTSVKVHHAPGGRQQFNIFGGYEAPTEAVQSTSKASYGYTPPPAPFGGRVPLKETVAPPQTYADSYAPSYGAYAPPVSKLPAA